MVVAHLSSFAVCQVVWQNYMYRMCLLQNPRDPYQMIQQVLKKDFLSRSLLFK